MELSVGCAAVAITTTFPLEDRSLTKVWAARADELEASKTSQVISQDRNTPSDPQRRREIIGRAKFIDC
jgi:hypothetical protein